MIHVIGLGAGGHAKVVIEILRLMGNCECVGLLDPKRALWGTKVLNVPVLGDDSLLPELNTFRDSPDVQAAFEEWRRQHG